MKSAKIFLIFVVFCTVGLLSSGVIIGSEHIPKLSNKEVVAIAKAKAQKSGYDLKKYDLKTFQFEFAKKDKTWNVFFEGKSPTRPGYHFFVLINDDTKKAT